MISTDRTKYPINKNGRPEIDLDSGKYVKLWQGPQHPGVTGNMALELTLCGDEVVHCQTHVGYLHRGFEKLMEQRKFIQNTPIVCRICVPEPDTNEYLYAAAIEDLAGIEAPERAKWLRTLNLELSRLGSFLMWIGGQAGAFGLGTVAQWTITHRDYILDLFEEMTGGRVYHMYMIPGGVRGPLPDGFEERLENTMVKVEKLLAEIEKVVFNNAVFKGRAKGLGIITPDMVDKYGVVGPNARAAGFARDVRKDTPYEKYGELDFSIITGTESDAYDRALVRYHDMFQSISIIRQIMKKMPKTGPYYQRTPNVLHWKIPPGETFVKAEATRGEYGYYVVTDGSEYPRRVCVRGPSYAHAITLLEDLIINVDVANVAGLMVSLHTCPPEIER